MSQLFLRVRVSGEVAKRDAYLVLEVLVDGRPLIDCQQYGLALDFFQLRESKDQDGGFFIVTCACGVAECAGIKRGIRVTHDQKSVHWVVRGLPPRDQPTGTFCFSREE